MWNSQNWSASPGWAQEGFQGWWLGKTIQFMSEVKDEGTETHLWFYHLSPLCSEKGWSLLHSHLVKKPGIQHGDQLFPAMLPECGHVTLNVLFDSLHLSFLICRLKCLIDWPPRGTIENEGMDMSTENVPTKTVTATLACHDRARPNLKQPKCAWFWKLRTLVIKVNIALIF